MKKRVRKNKKEEKEDEDDEDQKKKKKKNKKTKKCNQNMVNNFFGLGTCAPFPRLTNLFQSRKTICSIQI